ncbi:uncharacterized protein LOC143176991 [Calliopsis andreniformis]|uniref:uncharacterized protein LOC143176991 n=1 Tax=Calliopsis andreniformis TaxID=337506 RepID=UPI003FCD2600
MNNIETEIKKWIELIQIGKLEKVTEDIQATTFTNVDRRINKHIFKLLLYLSHTADKCDKQNYVMGKEIYELTCSLCLILSEIPDSNKFVSSLFHIVRCLLAMSMYNEALVVCSHLKAETFIYSCENVSDILVKIAYLWHNTGNNAFNALQKNLDSKYYYDLKAIIECELEIIHIVYESYTKHLLMKISSYLDKIASISKELTTCFEDFYKFVIKYLNQAKLVLHKDEKYTIARHMLHIVSRIVYENINERGFITVITDLSIVSDHFKKILIEDEECYQCFQEFESLYLILMKPADCLVEKDAEEIKVLCNNYIKISEKYGYAGPIKWTTLSIVQVLESLFIYWEICMRTGKKMFLKSGVLLEIMNLVEHINICFIKQTLDKCKICQNNECMIKQDIYNAVVTQIRCLNLISKLSKDDLPKDVCRLAVRFLEQSVTHIYHMKKCKCKCWTNLWSTCSALIYNLGITSECYYKESVSFFSLLCNSIVHFEGVQEKSQYIKLKNPVCSTLHRLSALHYTNGMYKEAMIASALNALLSYNDVDSKAFRMWANIKYKLATSKETTDMTILACLRANKAKLKEFKLSTELSEYDLVEICLREAQGLQEAKINLSNALLNVLTEMVALKVSPVQYARVVQMLAYHLLHFDHDENIMDYLKQAVSKLREAKINKFVLCLQANLEFHIFVNELRIMSKKTQVEMENTKFALYAPKSSEVAENESHDVVPTYTMINIKQDATIMRYLQTPIKKWNKCFKQNIEEIVNGYEPKLMLDTLIIAGEYAHLYHYQECEINIWKIAYKLASELQDNRAMIYVIGRSISLRNINHDWINTAKELTLKLKDNNDEDINYAIAVFWISLSDYYFECNMYDEARKLLDDFKKLPGISFFSNIAVYLYSLDRILYNCYLYKENIKHQEYTRYIVETLYTLIHLNEELTVRKWKPQDKHLFSFDILLSATVNLSLRMNSLLSFREIGAHLVRRLKTAQTLGATLRVVEILKSLCYIDLSRSQLSDCEVKLQGLEHILNIETFKTSMNNNSTKVATENLFMTPTRVVDPVRDIPRNDASPVLRNKVFELPEFICHSNCDCYACQNVSYRYLVFITTHIRAQLYALQQNFTMSLQHFHGAFKIKENLKKIERWTTKEKNGHMSWQERFYCIDYVLLLINFAYFLNSYSKTEQDRVADVILLAIEMCDVYKLKGHPIYMLIKELMFDERFQKMFTTSDYSLFTVPDSSNIDISKYVQKSKVEDSICLTPTISNPRVKKAASLRRNRTPPLLKLSKISMNFSDDEDISTSPPSAPRRTRSNNRITRRKLLDEEYSENSSQTKEKTEESQNISFLKEFMNLKESNFNNICMRDIVNKMVLLVPSISEYLTITVESMDAPVTNESIKELIKMIEHFQTTVSSKKQIRRTRYSKQSVSNDNTKIDEFITFFKDLTINEQKDNTDLINKNDLISEPNMVSHASSHHKPRRTSEQNKKERLNQNNLPLITCNKVDELKKTCAGENSRSRITRNSIKRSMKLPRNE